jgi:hypothetical protein
MGFGIRIAGIGLRVSHPRCGAGEDRSETHAGGDAMRKLALSVAALFLMAGLVVAAEVTVVKYDKDSKTVTVKEGTSEKSYKISDATKVTLTDKDGKTKEGKLEDLTRRLEFASKGDKKREVKLDITTSGDKITEVKMRSFGGKKKKDN